MPSRMYSQWSPYTPTPRTDEERHDTFSRYARQVAANEMPWLFPLLDAANAKVIVGPAVFCVILDDGKGELFTVPEMESRIGLIPWIEDQETPQ